MRTETKWAIIAALALFAILLVEKFTGLQTAEKVGTWIIVDIILAVILFLVMYSMETWEKREKELNGVMTWKEGFWSAAIMTLIFIPLSSLLILIFLKYINTDAAAILMSAAGGDHTGKDAISNYMYLHLINALSFGLVFSLIFPLFMKKKA
jgi:hypothetical protein